MTFVFKHDNTKEVYINGWKQIGQNEYKPVMKAGKEETTCLLGVARKCSIKAFVHVLVKGMKDESPAPEPLIKDGRGRKKYSCWMEERKVSIQIQVVIPVGWTSQREFNIPIWH